MKLLRLLLLIFIALFISSAICAQSQPPITIKESDGSPKLIQPTEIIVPNGSLTVSGRKAILTFGGGVPGSGTVTSVSVVTANGISGSVANATSAPAITLTVQNAAADGSTKGIASFTAADFNASSGIISIDYTNAQKATSSVPGLLTAADWSTFNSKIGGSGTANAIPRFTGSGSIGDSSYSISGSGQFQSSSDFNFVSATGIYQIGDSIANFLHIDATTLNQWHAHPNDLTLDTIGKVQLGDPNPGAGNFTRLEINDTAGYVKLNAAVGTISIGDADAVNLLTLFVTDTTNQKFTFTSGSVNIGTTTPLASSIFTIASTTQGLLPPRMTTTQRDAISSPAEGLYLYNLTTHVTNYWNGSTWLNGGGGVSSSRAVNAASPLGGGGTLASDLNLTCLTCGVTGSPLSQFASTTSAQLRGVLSDEAGGDVAWFGPKRDIVDAGAFCTDAGSNDTYACSLSPAITGYVTGVHYRFVANTANTGTATVNLNSIGAKTIVKVAGGITTALADNDIRAGQWVDVVYDGTNMQMQSLLGNAPSGGGGTPAGSSGDYQINSSGSFGAGLINQTSGNVLINIANTASGTIQFGGTGNTRPGIRTNGVIAEFVLADQSNFAGIKVDRIAIGNVTNPTNSGLVAFNAFSLAEISSEAAFLSNPSQAAYMPLRVSALRLFGAANLTVDTAIERNAAGKVAFTQGSGTTGNGDITFTNAVQLGKTTTYNNVATAGNGLAAIVAAGRVTAQSAANASIATYTVGASDSSFEISMNMNVTAATILSTSMNCDYTDESNTARTMILPTTSIGGTFLSGGMVTATGSFETAVFHIRCKAGTAVTLYTATGTFTGVTYTGEGNIKQTK